MVRTKVVEPAQWRVLEFKCPECGKWMRARNLGLDNTDRCGNCGALIEYEEVNDETNRV